MGKGTMNAQMQGPQNGAPGPGLGLVAWQIRKR
jgi:hypothetical protein